MVVRSILLRRKPDCPAPRGISLIDATWRSYFGDMAARPRLHLSMSLQDPRPLARNSPQQRISRCSRSRVQRRFPSIIIPPKRNNPMLLQKTKSPFLRLILPVRLRSVTHRCYAHTLSDAERPFAISSIRPQYKCDPKTSELRTFQSIRTEGVY